VNVFAGCNRWSGKIGITNKEIFFLFMYRTFIACHCEYERELGEANLSEGVYYNIENDVLSFSKNDNVIMTLKKSD